MSRVFGWLMLALPAVLGLWLFARGCMAQVARLTSEGYCSSPYCDYGLFWTAGVLRARGLGAAIYDYPRYQALAGGMLGVHGFLPFEYPPMMLLPDMVLARLPFVAGYYVFTVASLAAVVALLRVAGVRWWCIAAGLMSPAAMWEIYLGQVGLLCGAGLLAGLVWMERRPALAGGGLGLLCVKPHYALLVPVAVLARRQWRAVVAGVAVVSVLLVLSRGGGVWTSYLGPGAAEVRAVMTAPFGAAASDGGTSVYWMLRSFHVAPGPALAGQVVASVVVAAWIWSLWRRGAGRADIVVVTTFLTSPYGYMDDLAIVSVILPTLLRPGQLWRNAALVWVWVLPAYLPKFTAMTGVLVTPLLLCAVLWIVTDTERTQSKQKFPQKLLRKGLA